MESRWIFVLVATAGLLLAELLLARGPMTLDYLFRAPGMGWPHGVQEDDDVRWRWPPGPRRVRPAERRSALDGAFLVAAQPVRGRTGLRRSPTRLTP